MPHPTHPEAAVHRIERGEARTPTGAAILDACPTPVVLMDDAGRVTITDPTTGRVLATGTARRLRRLTPTTVEAADLIQREALGWPRTVVEMAERLAYAIEDPQSADALAVGRAAYRAAKVSTSRAGARAFARLVVAELIGRRAL